MKLMIKFPILTSSIMKNPYCFSDLILICLSLSTINAQMMRSHSSDEDNAPLLAQPKDDSKGKSVSIPIAVGSSEYHAGKLAHHQQKVAYHEAMSKNLAYDKHDT